MIEHLNWTATAVFIFFFVVVTVLGFVAARWKQGDLNELHEWGLGGRRFGTFVSWFLIGGDLYTAYTVIAVPALVYAVGAYGFFAVPYTILIYPLLYAAFPRLWRVTHKRGYLTSADFVLGRYGNRWLELAIAVTGIVATMPYIALQLVGIEKVVAELGFQGEGYMAHAPLTVAFLILALYTYKSGLRAPAMIAFVKDTMIYIFVIAAIIVIPYQLGGYGKVFDAAADAFAKKGGATGMTLKDSQFMVYITTALGSAMALFIYPHSITGIMSASDPKAIKRNAIALPAYSLILGLIGILGLMGYAAGIKLIPDTQMPVGVNEINNVQQVVPRLFTLQFPSWFAGFSFAAIAIGALVPAAVMSIGAANTFTRNIWKPFIDQTMNGAEEAFLAKLMSLIVKVGALAVILWVDTKYAIDFQLLGGVLMIQCFPAIIFGLYTRWFKGWALLAGWLVGTVVGTFLSLGTLAFVPLESEHGFALFGRKLLFTLGAKVVPSHWVGDYFNAYNGVTSVCLNIIVAVALSLVLRQRAVDETEPSDYHASPVASA